MQKRIFKTLLLVALIVLVVAIVLTSVIIGSYYENQLKEELKNESKIIVEIYNFGGIESIFKFAKEYQNRITIVGSDGVVIFDNEYDESKMDNHMNRFEIFSAIEYGEGEATRLSDTLSQNSFYYAKRLADGNVLRISKLSANMFGMIGNSIPWLIFVFLIALVLVAVISNKITKRIVKPINKIDLEDPLDNDTYEELSPLLMRMNKQRQQINSQIEIINKKQQEYDDVINNMHEGLLMVGGDGKIISMNTSAKDIFNKKDGESYLSINRNAKYLNAIESGLEGCENSTQMTLSGKTYEIRVSPVENADKTFSVVAIIIDIEDKLLAEKQRKEFSSNVSHELKTPLTSIMGYAEIISNGIAKDQDAMQFGGKIQSEARRLYALVQDILTISKLEETNNTIEKENVEMLNVVNEVVKNLFEKASAKNVKISVNGEGYTLFANKSSCYQMAFNVIENAINYNKEGGTVDVFVSVVNGKKQLKVIDSGIGISNDNLNHIFERFYRVDKSRSKNTGGTGLGLAIVKHTVMALNGEINIESKINEGTKIIIEF